MSERCPYVPMSEEEHRRWRTEQNRRLKQDLVGGQRARAKHKPQRLSHPCAKCGATVGADWKFCRTCAGLRAAADDALNQRIRTARKLGLASEVRVYYRDSPGAAGGGEDGR